MNRFLGHFCALIACYGCVVKYKWSRGIAGGLALLICPPVKKQKLSRIPDKNNQPYHFNHRSAKPIYYIYILHSSGWIAHGAFPIYFSERHRVVHISEKMLSHHLP